MPNEFHTLEGEKSQAFLEKINFQEKINFSDMITGFCMKGKSGPVWVLIGEGFVSWCEANKESPENLIRMIKHHYGEMTCQHHGACIWEIIFVEFLKLFYFNLRSRCELAISDRLFVVQNLSNSFNRWKPFDPLRVFWYQRVSGKQADNWSLITQDWEDSLFAIRMSVSAK